MSTFQHIRQTARRFIALCMLAYGLALALPTLAPQAMQMVCSGASMKLVVGDTADGEGQRMDCPLCGAALPSPPAVAVTMAVDRLAHALQPVVAANIASLTAPPLPARGPPAL